MGEKLKPGYNVVIHLEDEDFSKYMNPPEEDSDINNDENNNEETTD